MRKILVRKRQLEILQDAIEFIVFGSITIDAQEKEELRTFYEKHLIKVEV